MYLKITEEEIEMNNNGFNEIISCDFFQSIFITKQS
jgi:hypothetical protein